MLTNIKSIKTNLDDSGYTENYGGSSLSHDEELTRTFSYDAINKLLEAIGREAKTNGAAKVWDQNKALNSNYSYPSNFYLKKPQS